MNTSHPYSDPAGADGFTLIGEELRILLSEALDGGFLLLSRSLGELCEGDVEDRLDVVFLRYIA